MTFLNWRYQANARFQSRLGPIFGSRLHSRSRLVRINSPSMSVWRFLMNHARSSRNGVVDRSLIAQARYFKR
jgi:hypothetical protein